MTTDAIVASLASAGFHEADARSRAALFADAAAALERAGRSPAWGWFVPGRIEVFGKHTDYAGGHSLVGAVPRGFALVAAPRPDRRVRALDARWGDAMEVDPVDTTTVYRGWANYVAVVARRLALNFPDAGPGVDIAFASDLPRASGVSSSSALVVAVASACIRAAALDQRADFRAELTSPHDLAGYLGAVENGLTFKSLASRDGVGTHGGSEDHNAILTCTADRVSAFSYVPVRPAGSAPMPEEWRFVIVSSGVQADKAGSARERYNRASLLTRALLELWNRLEKRRESTLAAVLASGPGAEAELRAVVARGGHPDYSPDDLRRRLDHFIGEDRRVLDATRAFAAADARALDALSAASQRDAETLLGNQIPETQRLAELARHHGAFAASSFGAGFGGSVWALAPADIAMRVAEDWAAAYREAFPKIGTVDWFVTRPSPSLTEVPIRKGSELAL